MIRPMRPDDIEHMLSIAAEVYPAFDVKEARVWAHAGLRQPNMAFFRDGDSCVIAAITQAYFGGPQRCFLLYLFGKASKRRAWEACRLLKAVDAWRKAQGAESLHFGEDTGIDFAPLAKRLGAKMDRPVWRLEGGHTVQPRFSPRLSLALSGGGRLSALQQAMRM